MAFRATRDLGAAKERLLGAMLGGLDRARAEAMGRRVAERLALSEAVADRVRDHLAAGDEVWIASASVDLVVGEVARVVGARGGIGTALAIEGDRLTGRFVGVNCKGPEKLRRLDAELRAGWRDGAVAYSDSSADTPLMTAVAEACWVRRGRLRETTDGEPA